MVQLDPMLMSMMPEDIRSMFLPYVSVQLWALLLNLLIGFILSLAIGAHFRRYASAFCNRKDFSRLFPFLMLTIILIITVVKASLALALGLVGALSIVRFRTPIKEPEELIYLFFTIGVAVSLGAGQTLAAVLSSIVALILMTWLKRRDFSTAEETGLFLCLHIPMQPPTAHDKPFTLERLQRQLSDFVERVSLRRFDLSPELIEVNLFIQGFSSQQLDDLFSELKVSYPGIQISALEQHNIAGV